jgi:hypothetical protein
MMQNITFHFPVSTQAGHDFFDCLNTILAEVPHTQLRSGISLSVLKPDNAYPVTSFHVIERGNFPTINLDSNEILSSLVSETRPAPAHNISEKHDDQGTYYEVTIQDTTLYRLPIEEMMKRLKGHVTRVDHTGLNLPSKLVGRNKWNELINDVSLKCNLYKYPTDDDWPFILPATNNELETDITTFPVGRGPKFELVYDAFSSVPTIQIDLEVDFERRDVEQLFPAPYGISFPDLAEYFRTVYVHHEWFGLDIRFDIRFKSTNPLNDWDTGKWLAKNGGRINHRAP